MPFRFNPFTGNLDEVDTTAAAGSDTQIQYNDNGSLAGSADLAWDDDGKVLDVAGDINLDDGGLYQTLLQLAAPTANRVITFPDATGTVALVGGSSGQLLYNLDGAVAGTQGTYSASDGHRFVLPFGYGAGAGGTVTQATNKSTGVTLDTRCGQVTMNNAQLDAATAVSFTLTNSQIAATDLLIINHVSGGTTGAYLFGARAAAGSATVTVRNVSAGNLSEALVLGFAVIKASTT